MEQLVWSQLGDYIRKLSKKGADMNRERFREIHDLLMEQLDVSRELSDEEILEVIDDLILNQSGKSSFFH